MASPGVDGSYGPNGNTTITVPCNGQTHTYLLTAKAANGPTATRTISVATHVEANGPSTFRLPGGWVAGKGTGRRVARLATRS